MLTSGFGLVGGDDDGGNGQTKGQKPEKEAEDRGLGPERDQDDTGPVPIAGVQGLAGEVAEQVVKPAGFKVGEKADATSGFETSVIMHEPGEEDGSAGARRRPRDQLGDPDVSRSRPTSPTSPAAPRSCSSSARTTEALGPPPG